MKPNERIQRIAFRIEANEKIGMGHLMRCLTIIRELKRNNTESTIYSSSAIDKKLIYNISDYVKINTKAFSSEDAYIVAGYMNKRKESILFVDSYEVTAQYLQSLKKYQRVILTDSFCDFDIEMVIQPNAFLEQEIKNEGNADIYLRGLTYQPIRNDFFLNSVEIKEKVTNLLILSGGTFPKLFCMKMIEEIYKWGKIETISIVLGYCVSDSEYEALKKKFENCNLRIYRNVSNMSEIMSKNDVVISACGSTIYEIMACGLPVIVYSMADNQRYVLEKLQSEAGILYAGDIKEEITCANIIQYLEMLLNRKNRETQVFKMRQVISCNGAENIVKMVMKYLG